MVNGGLAIEVSSDNESARNRIETHSCFNKLMFHSFEGLILEILSSYNEFSKNINFHNKSLSHLISWKFNSWKVDYCLGCVYLTMPMSSAFKIEVVTFTYFLGSYMFY